MFTQDLARLSPGSFNAESGSVPKYIFTFAHALKKTQNLPEDQPDVLNSMPGRESRGRSLTPRVVTYGSSVCLSFPSSSPLISSS